jgi:CheY-like chemotaxis protein
MSDIKLVYLIDDDSFLLDMYAIKFKECGLPVEAVSDPKVALDKIRAGATPDIVIVDIIMPGMTGFDFLEALQKENLVPNARKIVLSNQGQQEDIERATKFGATGYIIKASAIPSEVCDKVLAISATP